MSKIKDNIRISVEEDLILNHQARKMIKNNNSSWDPENEQKQWCFYSFKNKVVVCAICHITSDKCADELVIWLNDHGLMHLRQNILHCFL